MQLKEYSIRAGAPEAGGAWGQIVPFDICLTEIFLDLLYI